MNRWSLAAASAAVGVVTSTAAMAATLVVLESDLVGLQPGDIVDGGQPLDVPDGKRLTLISEAGETVALEGPFSGLVESGGGGDATLVAALSDLILSEGEDVSSLGAIRADTGVDVDDPWLIDLARAGDHCAPADRPPVMWRRSPDMFSEIRVSDGRKAAITAWPADSATLDWPPPIAVVDGARYKLTFDGEVDRYVVLHLVPGDLGGDPRRAAWMAAQGCRQQALLLLIAGLR